MTTCPKCAYTRQPSDTAPKYQCPQCGIVYAKFGEQYTPSPRERDPSEASLLKVALGFVAVVALFVGTWSLFGAAAISLLLPTILLGLIPAFIAKQKGRSFAAWWLYGTALFLIALPHSLLMKVDDAGVERRQFAEGMKKCPHCAEYIKGDARVCRYCGRNSLRAA